LFLDSTRRLAGGGVFVARGKVARILADRGAVLRFARREGIALLDLGDRVLAPGFVDAHAHLELSALEGKLPGRGSFADWIRKLVAQRAALSAADLRRSVERGVSRLLASGTTAVGDIDSTGTSEAVLRAGPLRARVYREILDLGDPVRSSGALTRAARPAARSASLRIGLSPHAPYTVGAGLLRSAAGLACRRGWPAAVHWAETVEEVDWLARGRGPMRAIFARSAGLARSAPRGGLAVLAAAGLLGPDLALVHGNHPEAGDIERIARSGATLVHCPGTHAFFGRRRFGLRAWIDAGVTVALGTDGLSSNRELDMRREMSLLRRAHAWLPPATVFEMATRSGARAIGFAGETGEISERSLADVCAHGFPELSAREARSAAALLDALTSGRSTVDGVWIGGRSAVAGPEFSGELSESRGRIAE
jgi:cytosine/adenosine deaminase-related metal-dependent hydrolase